MASTPRQPREVTVAAHASSGMPSIHCFSFLRQLGHEVWMVVHPRTRPELIELLGAEVARATFILGCIAQKMMHKVGRALTGRPSI